MSNALYWLLRIFFCATAKVDDEGENLYCMSQNFWNIIVLAFCFDSWFPISKFIFGWISQNGFLLRKYTYLGNDSSYSVATEDGVEISYLDNNSSDTEKRSPENMEELSSTSSTSENIENGSSKMQSFSFEAQVIQSIEISSLSPKLSFYYIHDFHCLCTVECILHVLTWDWGTTFWM